MGPQPHTYGGGIWGRSAVPRTPTRPRYRRYYGLGASQLRPKGLPWRSPTPPTRPRYSLRARPTGPPYRLRARATGRGRIAGGPTPDIWGRKSSPPGVRPQVRRRSTTDRVDRTSTKNDESPRKDVNSCTSKNRQSGPNSSFWRRAANPGTWGKRRVGRKRRMVGPGGPTDPRSKIGPCQARTHLPTLRVPPGGRGAGRRQGSSLPGPVRLTYRAGPSLIRVKCVVGSPFLWLRHKKDTSRFGGRPPGRTHGVRGRNPSLRPV
eukprot:gene17910-biopygen21901